MSDFLLPKAQNMQYWRGAKQTEKEAPKGIQLFAGTARKWSTKKTYFGTGDIINFNEVAPGTAH